MEDLDEKGGRGLVGELAKPPLRLRNLQQLGRECPRGISVLARAQRLHGKAGEIFDKRQPEHDRNRPELADRERRDVLIGVREPAQQLLVEAAGGVRDEIAREYVDARIAAPAPADQRRQLFVVPSRKVSANFEQLRANDVVVVAQPLFGGRLGRLGEPLLGQLLVNLLEAGGVPLEPSQQFAPRTTASRRRMLCRELHARGLRADRAASGARPPSKSSSVSGAAPAADIGM